MNTEERLRAAFDARVRTVDPDALAPLVAPVRRRRAVWAVPVAASVVALVVVAATVLGGIMSGSHGALSGGAPQYLVTVQGDGTAEVRDPSNGHTITSVPGGGYVAVTAVGDGTFYLAARAGDCRVRLYRTSVGRDASVAKPTPLSGEPLAVSPDDTGLSASPDGSRLTVSGTCDTTYRVAIVSRDTGAMHEWTGHSTASARYVPTWTADGRAVGVLWWDVRRDIAKAPLLLLDPDRSGDLAGARVLRTMGIEEGPLKGARIESIAFNPDGRSLTALLSGPPAVAVLSATTGRPTGQVTRLDSDGAGVLRLDRSGRHVLLIGSDRIGIPDGTRVTWHTDPHEYRDAAW